jgi:hypothetical protein
LVRRSYLQEKVRVLEMPLGSFLCSARIVASLQLLPEGNSHQSTSNPSKGTIANSTIIIMILNWGRVRLGSALEILFAILRTFSQESNN